MSFDWECPGADENYPMSISGMRQFCAILEALHALPEGLKEEQPNWEGEAKPPYHLTETECRTLANRLKGLTVAELSPALAEALRQEQRLEHEREQSRDASPKPTGWQVLWRRLQGSPVTVQETPFLPTQLSPDELSREAAAWLDAHVPFIDFMEACAEHGGCDVWN